MEIRVFINHVKIMVNIILMQISIPVFVQMDIQGRIVKHVTDHFIILPLIDAYYCTIE